MKDSFFNHISIAPVDPIFGLTSLFQLETNPHKVNLSVGVYQDDTLHTPVLKSVKKAESYLWESEKTKKYLPIEGSPSFITEVRRLIFGDVFCQEQRVCGIQTIGGTGALWLGANFLKLHLTDAIAVSNPAWPNYKNIFTLAGMNLKTYPYYDYKKHEIDFDACAAFLQQLPNKTCVVFQACCHNPTGINFSLDQWRMVKNICKKKQILPFFDFAYQGFGRSLEEDSFAIRLFVEDGMEVFVAYSCSKNFGLYSERVGAFFSCINSAKTAQIVESQLKSIVRAGYSNPPRHGGSVVTTILSTPDLKAQWQAEVNSMRERITYWRHRLVEGLASKNCRRDFQFLLQGEGMFCYTGLEKEEVLHLQKEFGIYMTLDGRLNTAGLCDHNLEYVVHAIASL